MKTDNTFSGEEIVSRQNHDDNINRLAAQNSLYRKGKRLSIYRFWLSVVLMVTLAFANFFLKSYHQINIEWLVAAYAFTVLLLDNLFITPHIRKVKELAASIQELFDVDVFGLSFNSSLIKRVDNEVVFENSRGLSDEKRKKLENWYEPVIAKVNSSLAVLICQRTNQTYDSNLRASFIRYCYVFSFVLFVILLFLSLYSDATLRSVLVNAVLPFLPVFQLVYLNVSQNKESINGAADVKALIERLWDRSIRQKEYPSISELRSIQDRIFLHRKNSPLLPEWFYGIKREPQESATRYSVGQLVKVVDED